MNGKSLSKVILSVSIALAFVATLFTGPATGVPENVPTEAAEDDNRGVAKWTILLYLVADNDLNDLTAEDYQELKDGGSSDLVNVLVLSDKLNDTAYLYQIVGNDMVPLESLGELNMGDPNTLAGFVEYSELHFPAEQMLLYFWDHGTPTAGVGVDTTLEGSEPGTDWDWLSHHEVISALAGHHIDVIACDECSIGQIETLYEYASNGLSVDYFVASENYIGYRGFSYDKIHQRLVLDPDMSALELCQVIVEEFTNLFNQPPYKSETLTTQSIFDMSKIISLGDAVNAMAVSLAEDIDSYKAAIRSAQLRSIMPWGARGESWIDMMTFVEELMAGMPESDPAYGLCEAVVDLYAETMLGMGTAKNTELYGYKGIGILFPASHSSYVVAYADSEWGGFNTYITYNFPGMGWWPFLEAYWGLS